MKVEGRMDAALRQVELNVAETGDPAHLRVDSRLHQARGHRGVDRIAARLQDVESCLHRFRLRR